MYGYDHFGMGLGGIGMILVWLVPLILLVLLFRRYAGNGEARKDKTALDILEARYAGGEIDREEYLKRRADLKD
ncbi:MAG: SHOCT domain-containing protein [Pseudomonadota bacterium]|nr:SHOCT domain-containing protein [Pseudomonadota bacterium]MDP1903482.1 SHOCT domain-containing protein [Pseudomonadota bacterium]MDP2351561.1 SHOCT domain-containing protein [Pseudomonadota bacterium]